MIPEIKPQIRLYLSLFFVRRSRLYPVKAVLKPITKGKNFPMVPIDIKPVKNITRITDPKTPVRIG